MANDKPVKKSAPKVPKKTAVVTVTPVDVKESPAKHIVLLKSHQHAGKTYDVGTPLNDIVELSANNIAYMRKCGTI